MAIADGDQIDFNYNLKFEVTPSVGTRNALFFDGLRITLWEKKPVVKKMEEMPLGDGMDGEDSPVGEEALEEPGAITPIVSSLITSSLITSSLITSSLITSYISSYTPITTRAQRRG